MQKNQGVQPERRSDAAARDFDDIHFGKDLSPSGRMAVRRDLGAWLKNLWQTGRISADQYLEGLRVFSIRPRRAEWLTFGKNLAAMLGVLLLTAGIIMFLAWNWQDMHKFLKFASFQAFFLMFALVALWKWGKPPGQAALLGAAVMIGALMALYGQVYQTGADDWELFRAWAVMLVPLALLSGTTAIYFMLWLVGGTALTLYLVQELGYSGDIAILHKSWIFLLAQASAWFLAELGCRLTRARRVPFDPARWLTRLIGAATLILLSARMTEFLLNGFGYPYHYDEFSLYLYIGPLLYAAVTAAAFLFYYRKFHDFFFVTLLVFSLVYLLGTKIVHGFIKNFNLLWGDDFAPLLISGLVIIGLCLAGTKCVFVLRGKMKRSEKKRLSEQAPHDAPAGEKGDDSIARDRTALALRRWLEAAGVMDEEERLAFFSSLSASEAVSQPWYMKIPLVLAIWVGSMFILAFLILALFAGTDLGGVSAFGFILCAIGVFLSRLPGFTARQFALVGLLAGTVCAGAICLDEPLSGGYLYFLLFLLLWALLSEFSAKAICFALALGALLYISLYYEHGGLWGSYLYVVAAYWVRQAVLAPLLAAALFYINRPPKAGNPYSLHLDGAAWGTLLFTLLYFLLFNILRSLEVFGLLSSFPVKGAAAGILLAGLLLAAVWRKAATALAACGLALASLTWFAPGAGLALALLLSCRLYSRLTGQGMALAYLGAGLWFYYYNLGITFLQKSIHLSVAGGILIALAVILHHIWKNGASAPPPFRKTPGGIAGCAI